MFYISLEPPKWTKHPKWFVIVFTGSQVTMLYVCWFKLLYLMFMLTLFHSDEIFLLRILKFILEINSIIKI